MISLEQHRKYRAYAEFDAVANYDCMILTLAVLTYSCLGLGKTPRKMLLDALEGMIHRVCTDHGHSEGTYQEDLLRRLFGTGQGSGGLPYFWISASNVVLACLDKKLEGFKAINPTGNIISVRNEDVFVDDSGLVVDDSGGDVVDKLRQNSQLHEKFLHVTGGKLALQNRFWALIQWS